MLASSAQGLSSQVSPQICLANMLYRQCLWLLLVSSSVQVGIKLSVAHVSCWVPLRAGSPHWNTRWVGKEKTRSCWALMTLCSLCRVPERSGSRRPRGPAGDVPTALPLHGSAGVSPAHTGSPTESRIWAAFQVSGQGQGVSLFMRYQLFFS